MGDRCKLCKEPLPMRALHFSNEIAILHGYCSWMCIASALGESKALELLALSARERA